MEEKMDQRKNNGASTSSILYSYHNLSSPPNILYLKDSQFKCVGTSPETNSFVVRSKQTRLVWVGGGWGLELRCDSPLCIVYHPNKKQTMREMLNWPSYFCTLFVSDRVFHPWMELAVDTRPTSKCRQAIYTKTDKNVLTRRCTIWIL